MATASLIAGGILSRAIESGVRREKVWLAGGTPAIRLRPETPGPYPIALLAHGGTASKETLFRFGEALAAAGFDFFTVDQAGHGESRQSFTLFRVTGKPEALARALGSVTVFLGHSMGGGAGAWSVREAGFVLTTGTWIGAAPTLHRIPVQLVLFGVIWLALAGINKLRMPRWSLVVLVGLLAAGCRVIAGVNHVFAFALLGATLGVSSLLLCVGTIVGRIAARGGTRQAGDFAMAIFASYTIGQCVPMLI